MSQDHAEALTPSPAQLGRRTQRSRQSHAAPPRADPEDRRPVKAGRAILLLAVAAIAVAYAGISGRSSR